MRNVLEKLTNSLESRGISTITGSTGGAFQPAKSGFAIRTAPEIKTETHGAYGLPSMPGLAGPAQSYSAATGQATFASYTEAQGVYSAAHLYTAPTYGTHAKQIPSTQLGSSLGYAPTGGMSYYQTQDSSSSSRTPATDWMRWSQANLNPFAQHTQAEYMTPSAASTLMSMSDTRSTSGAPVAPQGEQWPLNYYNSNHYAASHPG